MLTNMPAYTCLYIGPSDAVIECRSVRAANSGEAMDRVEHLLHSQVGLTAIEIWREGQLEMKFTWNEVASQAGVK